MSPHEVVTWSLATATSSSSASCISPTDVGDAAWRNTASRRCVGWPDIGLTIGSSHRKRPATSGAVVRSTYKTRMCSDSGGARSKGSRTKRASSAISFFQFHLCLTTCAL
uniref:Uncharacterized protein n=1 Tax=Coconut foliar decay virus TaxID=12474 RepID=A0A2R4N9E1_9VIRU|nr:hypothetical protein [Coconut foliar decay virus]AVX29458.1 hypothetical protein [Coconut foliar decay virus]AVX29460.1 hypothetical protein [Coconut foliar decay virus]